jgi:general secretion pathway protein M
MSRSSLTKLNLWVSAGAIAGYIALVAIALFFTGTGLSAIGEQRASVAAAEAMLARLERHSVANREDGSPLGDAPEGSPFLQGQTLNVAGATLLQRVASAIHRVGGNVLSSQVDLDRDRAKDGWVGLIVSCDLEQASLQPLLYNIEAGMPFLFIDQLDVQAPITSVDAGRMRVVLGVSGQWWSGK